MNEPIAISQRAAADMRQLLEQSQRINDRLNVYVEAIGAALDVAPGWRFDVQSMAFLPPATNREEVHPPSEPDLNERQTG